MIMPERTPLPGAAAGEDVLCAAVTELTAEIATLRGEVARRHLLDLATGILVAQLSLSPSDAAGHLELLAASTGLDVEDLAADMVNGASGDGEALPGYAASPADLGPTRQTRQIRRGLAAAEAGDTTGEIAAALLDRVLHPLGVRALWLWRRTTTDCLQLAGHAGVSALEASHWRWVPPEVKGPLHRVLAEGSPRWLPDGNAPGERLPGPSPEAARAVLPLRSHGSVTGLALAVWPGAAELDERIRRVLTGLIDPAARLLDVGPRDPAEPPLLSPLLDLLAHPAMMLRADPATSVLRVEYLNGAALQSSGGAHGPVGRPLAQVFPYLHADLQRLASAARSGAAAQYAAQLPVGHRPGSHGRSDGPDGPDGPDPMLDVRVLPVGPDHCVVLWHAATDPGLAVARVLERLEDLASFEDDLSSGESHWAEEAYRIFGLSPETPPIPLRLLGQRLHPGEVGHLAGLLTALTERRVGAHTVVRTLRDDGGLRHVRIAAEPLLTGGALTGITGVYQDVSAQYGAELALTAAFDRLTAAQAQAALRHQVVLQLQRAIVPEVPALEKLPGLQVAARYRPAAEEYRVGGDWYDVLPLPDGRVLLAVGDIAGHGIESATAMVALRNALHGLAFTGRSPGRLMEWLNELTLHSDGGPTATAVCGLYDPEDRSLRWASAGHLPPLLLREGRARLLELPPNILLGALPHAAYAEVTTPLLAGDTLLLYTDGLIERRHSGLDESLAALRRAAEHLGAGELGRQADRLLATVTGDTDDDTSLVVVRVC